MKLTLPSDSAARKRHPLRTGVFNYFPAALAGVAQVSIDGNDKHNPGQPLHHARGKSADHADCIDRHLTDAEDLIALIRRVQAGEDRVDPGRSLSAQLLTEVNQLAWRALAYAQEVHEKYGGAPLAPAAKTDDKLQTIKPGQAVPVKATPGSIDDLKKIKEEYEKLQPYVPVRDPPWKQGARDIVYLRDEQRHFMPEVLDPW